MADTLIGAALAGQQGTLDTFPAGPPGSPLNIPKTKKPLKAVFL